MYYLTLLRERKGLSTLFNTQKKKYFTNFRKRVTEIKSQQKISSFIIFNRDSNINQHLLNT